jgi:hypothetical protein
MAEIGRSFCILLALSCGLGQGTPQEEAKPAQARKTAGDDNEAKDLAENDPLFLGRYHYSELARGAFQPKAITRVLTFEHLSQELGMGDSQLARIRKIVRQGTEVRRSVAQELLERVRAGAAEGIPADPAANKAALDAIDNTIQAETAFALSAKQRKRLSEIALQARGPFAIFTDEELSIQLGLTPDQIQRGAVILTELERAKSKIAAERSAIRYGTDSSTPTEPGKNQARVGGPGNPQAPGRSTGPFGLTKERFKHLVDTIRQERDADQAAIHALEKVLTRRQKQWYARMVGEPYDFAAMFRSASRKPDPKASEVTEKQGRPSTRVENNAKAR